MAVLCFGPFRLDPDARQLTRDGTVLEAQDQVLDLLLLLLERPDGLWTREALHARLWPETIVSEDALFQAVAKARKVLGDAPRSPRWLATVPRQGYRFIGAVHAEQPAASANRPIAPMTSFLGRGSLTDSLVAAFAEAPGLWTLTGPGGVGKTRLAIELSARTSLPVLWCDLQTVERPDAIWVRIGQCLRLSASMPDRPDAIAAELDRQGAALLVLDNGEQIAGALAAVVARLARHAPRARLLVTSRIRLGLAGEQLIDLPPLGLPAAGADLSQLCSTAAGQLLLDRARCGAGWSATPSDLPGLVALTQALGGLPLAIELAAPRLRLLSPSQLLARMGQQLDLLGSRDPSRPDRHATLRSTIAASWALLDADHQCCLAQLSVLAGPFSVEAAESIVSAPGTEPLLVLAELIDHSLLRRRLDRPDRPMLELLPSIRAFARAHLAPEQRDAALSRLCAWYAAAAAHFDHSTAALWQASLERDSLILGLQHALGADRLADAAAIAGTLARALLAHGPLHALPALLAELRLHPDLSATQRAALLLLEAEACLDSTEVAGAGARLDEAARLLGAGDPLLARLALLRGAWHHRQGDLNRAREALTDGLALPGLSDEDRARLLLLLGQTETFAHNDQAALAPLEEARQLIASAGLERLRAGLCYDLGCAHLAFIGLESGRALLAESMDLATQAANPVAAARAQALMGRALLHLGRHDEARAALDAAEPLLRRAGLAHELGTLIDSRGHLAAHAGRLEEAVDLYRQAIRQLEAAGQAHTVMHLQSTLATVFIRLDRLAEAEALLQSALIRARQQGRSPAMILHNLAEIYLRTGRYGAARANARAALQINAANGKYVMAALDEATLGEIALAEGELGEATERLQVAADQLRVREHFSLLVTILGLWGLALGLDGRREASEAAFAEAAAHFDRPQIAPLRPAVLHQQAQVIAHHRDAEAAARLRARIELIREESGDDGKLSGALALLSGHWAPKPSSS